MGLIDIAGAILSRATERVEVSSQNVANMTTPGYRARRQSAGLIGTSFDSLTMAPPKTMSVDFSPGKLQKTDSPFDLALSGSGFFVVRSGDKTFYTRAGQFNRDADGRLVTAGGQALQSTSGDVIVDGSDLTISADGTVQTNGQPSCQLDLVMFKDLAGLTPVGEGLFAAPPDSINEIASVQVHQGMLETSNVSTADEIISVMAALRSAESGQHLIQVYDDLMGRAATSFGQA